MGAPATIALTPGEPAGIGPDLALELSPRPGCRTVVLADPALLRARARALGRPPPPWLEQRDHRAPISIAPHRLRRPARAGQLDPANAPYVLDTLAAAADGCLAGDFDALVTGPVHKGVINEAGVPFSGHTEFFAERCGAEPLMMLVAGTLRVALASTHLPLAAVPAALDAALISRQLRVLDRALRERYTIAAPVILVAGLNPHAGEGGHLGREEIEWMEPALDALRDEGLGVRGPLPADTLFTPHQLAGADAVLAMYHDQGLPVLKYAGFGRAVNVTLGLPIVRTSVDHGTALDLAGSGRAAAGSLLAAIDEALRLVRSA